jgi:hypothetical protein
MSRLYWSFSGAASAVIKAQPQIVATATTLIGETMLLRVAE